MCTNVSEVEADRIKRDIDRISDELSLNLKLLDENLTVWEDGLFLAKLRTASRLYGELSVLYEVIGLGCTQRFRSQVEKIDQLLQRKYER